MRITWWLHPGIHETARMNPDHYAHDTSETDSPQGPLTHELELAVGLAIVGN
jgi:hypothetical protein